MKLLRVLNKFAFIQLVNGPILCLLMQNLGENLKPSF